MCVCMYVCMYLYLRAYICIYTNAYIHICTNTCICVYLYFMDDTQVCLYYVCTCIYTYIYIIHTYIHTYTHAYIFTDSITYFYTHTPIYVCIYIYASYHVHHMKHTACPEQWCEQVGFCATYFVFVSANVAEVPGQADSMLFSGFGVSFFRFSCWQSRTYALGLGF